MNEALRLSPSLASDPALKGKGEVERGVGFWSPIGYILTSGDFFCFFF